MILSINAFNAYFNRLAVRVRQPSDYIMNKTEFYADLNRDFNALMAGETSFLATLANTSALLYERLTDVNWAGFYLLEDDTLVLGPFQAKLPVSGYPSGAGCAALRLPAIKCSVSRMFTRLTGILPVMRRVILKLFCRWW